MKNKLFIPEFECTDCGNSQCLNMQIIGHSARLEFSNDGEPIEIHEGTIAECEKIKQKIETVVL